MPRTSAGLLMYRWRADGGLADDHEQQAFAFEPASQDAPATGSVEDGAGRPSPAGPVLEVLLVHPGGPYFAKKDAGAWGIPKGELDDEGEDKLAAAIREFTEETGMTPDQCAADRAADLRAPGSSPPGPIPFVSLGAIKMQRHKVVHAWAFEGDCDPAELRSNAFTMEWPPRSGRTKDFPEVDRAAWFELPEARLAINASQRRFLDDLEGRLRR